MGSFNDLKIIDLSQPAILSIEEFPRGLKALLEIDEKNQVVISNIMELDSISRNNSMYSGEDFMKSLEACVWIEEMRRNGKWFGEFEHPDKDTSIDRFMKVDNDRISHRIRKYWRKGNMLQAEIDFKPLPLGPRAWSWVSSGSNPSFSVRVYTKNYVEKTSPSGKKYLHKIGKMIPVTFDFVTIPGFYSAYAADPDKYDIANENLIARRDVASLDIEAERKAFLDSHKLISSNSFESWKVEFTKDDFKSLVMAQESAPLLQEAFNMDLSKADMVYTKEGLLVINPIEKNMKNKKIIVPARTFELNRVLLDNSSKKRAQERVKTNYYMQINENNTKSGLDSESYRIQENELSAQEIVRLEKKVSKEEYKTQIRPKLEKQIAFTAYSFKKNLSEEFYKVFADSTLARINSGLMKKGYKKPLSKEDVCNAVLNIATPVNCVESLNNLENGNATKYIDIFKISSGSRQTSSFWFKRCLKETINRTREDLTKQFGIECLIKLFTQGDFSMESDLSNYDNQTIQVKVNLRVV